jgi:hypothetical protein
MTSDDAQIQTRTKTGSKKFSSHYREEAKYNIFIRVSRSTKRKNEYKSLEILSAYMINSEFHQFTIRIS